MSRSGSLQNMFRLCNNNTALIFQLFKSILTFDFKGQCFEGKVSITAEMQYLKKNETGNLIEFTVSFFFCGSLCRGCVEKLKDTSEWRQTANEKIKTSNAAVLFRFRHVSFLSTPSFAGSTWAPPGWKLNKCADIDPASSAGLNSSQPGRSDYLPGILTDNCIYYFLFTSQ